jgi:hypothetical protein
MLLLGVRFGPNTVKTLKHRDMERIQKAEIATLSIQKETRKVKRAYKRRKEDQDDAEYGAGMH